MKVRWYKITERLPDDCRDVLAYLSDGRMMSVCYLNNEWCGRLSWFTSTLITHWTDLPDAPEPLKDNEKW